MGCVCPKQTNAVVSYEPSMGAQLAGITGRDIQNTITVVFGITQNGQERIFSFDATTLIFKALDVPIGMMIWNYSQITHVSNKEIIITGGLSANASEISSQAYIYDALQGKAIRLPNMICHRYTHLGIFHKGKIYAIGGRDYGDDDNSAIRSQCECFNFKTHKWEKISKLNSPRCTGFTFIYKDDIYACGGLTGKMHRSRAIERYDEANDKWVILDFKLARGIECGSLISAVHFLAPPLPKDSFLIIGGNTELGAQDTAFLYNINTKTVISTSPIVDPRVLQKSIAYNNKVYIFGGSETDGLEYFDHTEQVWKKDSTQLFSPFALPEEIELFSGSQPPVTVPHIYIPSSSQKNSLQLQSAQSIKSAIILRQPYSNSGKDNEISSDKSQEVELSVSPKRLGANSDCSEGDDISAVAKAKIKEIILIEKAFLFGTDVDQFILEINFLTTKIERKSVPLSLRLFQHQGIVNIKSLQDQENKNYFILMGGAQEGMLKTVKYAYKFNPVTYQVTRIDNMIYPAYAFAVATFGKYVYLIGGKQSFRLAEQFEEANPQNKQICTNSLEIQEGNDNNGININGVSKILKHCQRLNCETMKWEVIADLNAKRVSSNAIILKNKLYIFGGFQGERDQIRPTDIEMYDLFQENSYWQLLSVKLPVGIEGAAVVQQQGEDSLLLFGGRIQNGEIKYIQSMSFLFGKNNEGKEDSFKTKYENEGSQQIMENSDEMHKEYDEEENQVKKGEDEIIISLKLEKLSQMQQEKSLLKVVHPYKNYILIFGGKQEQLVETFNFKERTTSTQSRVPHIDLLNAKLSLEIKKLRDSSMKTYSLGFM